MKEASHGRDISKNRVTASEYLGGERCAGIKNLTPCLPGKALVPWVAPMTHPARTAHPRRGVVSKQRLSGQCPVVRVMNERWMDGAS